MESLDYFVGVDWGSKAHQLCIVDRTGSICAQRSFEHSGRGLSHMAAWILDVTECPRQQLGIAIETPRGPVVESLLGRPSRSIRSIRNSWTGCAIASVWPGPRMTGSMPRCWPNRCVWTATCFESSKCPAANWYSCATAAGSMLN